MISSSALRRFLRDFADNIEREHPVPDFVPRHVRQSEIDVVSYTQWFLSMDEGPFLGRLPTAVALAALGELGKQLDLRGPSEVFFGVKKSPARTPWSYGSLYLEDIGGVSANESLSNGNGSLQTA